MQMLMPNNEAEAAKIGGEIGFAEMGRIYVRFAIANPAPVSAASISHMPMRVEVIDFGAGRIA